MGQLSLKDKACMFISLALAVMSSAAELEYFHLHWKNVTWAQARNHCQVCFKDLVTVTPENIQTISHNLTFDYWVGLRKNLNATSNSSVFWSHWANGDPLIFQNWYPGRPVSRSSLPRRYCCGCSASTTLTTTTTTSPDVMNSTRLKHATSMGKSGFRESTTPGMMSFIKFTDSNFTLTNVTEHSTTTQKTPPATTAPWELVDKQCVHSPMLPSDIPDDYIEDACVAMRSFGAWVERDCSDPLSFICYEEYIITEASVTEITSESTVVTWQPGPGTVNCYEIDAKTDKGLRNITASANDFSYNLTDLSAGIYHSVQVFPVKCGRRLSPQTVDFYTKPNKVENLRFNVTETSVFLSWSRPTGNLEFYLVEVQGGESVRSSTEEAEVDGLIPGNLYVFTVLSGVNDTYSEASNITKYTKPGKVKDLKVTENTFNSLLLSWTPPDGNASGFWVTARNESNDTLFDELMSETNVTVSNLTAGSEITLSVTALTDNNTLHGDTVTVVNYTVPGAVSNLTLVPSYDSINATWTVSSSSYSSFTVKIQLEGKYEQTIPNVTEPRKYFDGLKTAAQYTVMVHMVSGDLKGPTRQNTTFTRPLPPTNASIVNWNKTRITLQWEVPDNILAARYNVSMNTSFWNQSCWVIVQDNTTYTFEDLRPGTRYDFEVQTVTDVESSDPLAVSHFTDAEKREISLSMMCSSAEPLLCDQSTTWESVFRQLHDHFYDVLGDGVFWKLEKQETESK